MTDDDAMTPADRDDALAAEWVLGLLDDADMRAAQDRAARDGDFARRAQAWRERLAALADELADAVAPTRVKLAIDAALDRETAVPVARPPAPAAPPPRRAPAGGRPAARRVVTRRGWMAGAAAVAAAAALAWVLVPGDDFRPDFHAVPANAELAVRVDARIDSIHRVMQVEMTEGTPPPDSDMELWWIAGPDAVPVSLGVVPATGRLSVNLAPGMVPAAGVILAVSAEPRGGSPSGLPTGPVVAQAPITPV